jgi:hypothetical protein
MSSPRWPLAALALSLVMGCAKEIRRFTYPPEFQYLEGRELQSAMGRMIRAVRLLDEHLRAGPQAERVAELLAEIEENGRRLGSRHRPSNHPMIGEHIDLFLADVAAARRAAQAQPPSYFFAGSIVGSCRYCHTGR